MRLYNYSKVTNHGIYCDKTKNWGDLKENNAVTNRFTITFLSATVLPPLSATQHEVIEQRAVEEGALLLAGGRGLEQVLHQSSHDAMQRTREDGREEGLCHAVGRHNYIQSSDLNIIQWVKCLNIHNSEHH